MHQQQVKPSQHLGNTTRQAAAFVVLLLVLGALAWRLNTIMVLPGEPVISAELGRNGLADFRDVVYFPQQAVRAGVNPYDCSVSPNPEEPHYLQRYPVGNIFPLYSPLLFVLIWPLGAFDFSTSAAIYVGLNLLLAGAWIYLVLRRTQGTVHCEPWCAWLSVYFITQAGRANFLGGETGLPLTLFSYGALHWAERHPWWAGICLGFSSFKPTFGLPLGVMLLVMGRWKTVLIGWTFGLIAGLAGLGIIFYQSGDLPRFVEILTSNQQALEADPQAAAHTSGVRVDAAGALENWLPQSPISSLFSIAVVWLIGGYGIWRQRSSSRAAEFQFAIACLTVVAGIYHLAYDSLLLWCLIAWLFYSPNNRWSQADYWRRYVCLGCLLVPMLNLSTTHTFTTWLAKLGFSSPPYSAELADFAWNLACSANGLALFIALCLLVAWPCSPANRYQRASA